MDRNYIKRINSFAKRLEKRKAKEQNKGKKSRLGAITQERSTKFFVIDAE